MVDAGNDVAVGSKKGVSFDLFQSLRDRLLPKGTADLFQCIQSGVGRVLNQVNVGEATLAYQLRASTIDVYSHTSPNSLSMRKLRLLILSCGEPGKQKRQLESE